MQSFQSADCCPAMYLLHQVPMLTVVSEGPLTVQLQPGDDVVEPAPVAPRPAPRPRPQRWVHCLGCWFALFGGAVLHCIRRRCSAAPARAALACVHCDLHTPSPRYAALPPPCPSPLTLHSHRHVPSPNNSLFAPQRCPHRGCPCGPHPLPPRRAAPSHVPRHHDALHRGGRGHWC